MLLPSATLTAAWGGIALKSVLLLLLAWLAAMLLQKASAARRHLIWTAAAAALVALPILVIAVPKWTVPVQQIVPETSLVFRTVAVVTGTQTPSAPRPFPAPPAASAAFQWGSWLLLLWAAGTALGALRMLAAWLRIRHMRRNATPADTEEIDELRRLLGIRERVSVYLAGEGVMPMACGILQPVILMPSESAAWTAERRRIVLLHELAHVERGDLATHLLARCAVLLYWWNPLAWLAWREFLKERERAADDLVLRMGADAPGYASHLLDIARAMQSTSSAAVAMARKSELEGRMIAILDSKIDRKGAGAVLAGAAAALAICMTAPLASLQAQESRTPALAANPKGAPEIMGQANALRKLGRREEAELAYRKAAELFGDKPEAVDAVTALGVFAFIRKDLAAAEEQFKRAQLLDPGRAGAATMWTAMIRQTENRIPEAEALFQSALAVQGGNSQEAATTMELYAILLENAGRTPEAAVMKERATAIRKQVETAVYAPAPKSEALKIGGGVERPSLISKVEPVYTDEARAARYQGSVVLSVEIHPDGKPRNLRILRGLGLGLNEQAMDAVSRWQFRPGTKGGQPVTVAATIEVNYRLL
ncbi:MAG: TonB family protein [Bryobacterales bacterium]|nr:TonB family protein [Bryobacterales bacterium]